MVSVLSLKGYMVGVLFLKGVHGRCALFNSLKGVHDTYATTCESTLSLKGVCAVFKGVHGRCAFFKGFSVFKEGPW